MKTTGEEMLELAKKLASMFDSNNEAFMNCLVTGEAMRKIMSEAYKILVFKNIIPKIELLPIEDKNNIWERTKEFAAKRLSNVECIELSKGLYALEYFLNQ